MPNDARMNLAIRALSNTEPITQIADREGVSRQFVYRQKNKLVAAINDEFGNRDEDVLFYIPVTTAWLNQLVLGLALICRSSYRGIKELLRDIFGISLSIGAIHNHLHSAAKQATGIDASSTYCFLLEEANHRDADTWGVHLLDACKQGYQPDFTIADAAQGLRAGQKAAMKDIPCHGDVFHIQKQCKHCGISDSLIPIPFFAPKQEL